MKCPAQTLHRTLRDGGNDGGSTAVGAALDCNRTRLSGGDGGSIGNIRSEEPREDPDRGLSPELVGPSLYVVASG